MAEKLTLLCVDDDEDTLFITGLALQLDRDVATFPVRSAAAALDLLAGSETAISAILLDMQMPGMNGAELLSAIRALTGHADTPIIFLTASVRESETNAHRSLGAVGTIPKPYDPLTLAQTVRRMIAAG